MRAGILVTLFATLVVPAMAGAQDEPAPPSSWLDSSLDSLEAIPPAPAATASGNDPRSWRSRLGEGLELRFVEVFPGIDLALRGRQDELEAVYIVQPGSDPTAIRLELPGVTRFESDGHGHAVLRAEAGDVVLVRPGIVEVGESRRAVPGGYRYLGDGTVGLQVAERESKQTLLIGFHALFLPEALPRLDRDGNGRVDLSDLAKDVRRAPEGGPLIAATKVDSLAVDVDNDTQADPGDTLQYDIAVSNTGANATGVVFTDPIDPNLTEVAGSLDVSPLAFDDVYDTVGNAFLVVSSPLAGLFQNDTEFLGDAFVLTSPPPGTPTPTVQGGTITIAADGSFTYSTPLGFAGPTDSFTYTLGDAAGLTGTGTVTFNVAGRVWFVDSAAAVNGDGRQATPFNVLNASTVADPAGTGDVDAADDILFLYNNGGTAPTYTGGLVLESGQRLVGHGVSLVVGSTTVVPADTPPVLVNTGGNAIVLAQDASVEGLTVNAANNAGIFGSGALGAASVAASVSVGTSGSGAGLSLSGHSGTVTFSGSISGTGSAGAVVVDGGAGGLTVSGATLSKTAGRLVDVQNKTGGTVSFAGGSLTGSGAATDAVVVQANTGGSVLSFGAGLSVTTTNGRGLFANNGGTITVAGSASTINATGAAALDVTGTSFGGGATFATVSSTNSTAEGVRLNAATGSLSIGATSVVGPGTQGILVQGSSATVNFASTGTTTVSGGGSQRLLVTTSTGNIGFGNTTLSGGTDGVSLQNNSGGTRSFGTLAISGNGGVSFLHAVGGGATSVTGSTTITNPGGTGVDIQNSTTSVAFNGVTVNKGASSGTGVALANNGVSPSFGVLAVTASNGTGLAINASGIATSGGSITATNAPAINATGGNFAATFGTVSSTNSTSQGLNLVTTSGSLDMGGGSITGALGTSVVATGTLGTTTYAGSVTRSNAGKLVAVSGVGGGSLTLSGNLSCTVSCTGLDVLGRNGGAITFSGGTKTISTGANQAVTLTGNTGATIHFTGGGLDIDTSSAIGFAASGGGTVTVQGAGNTITAATGVALSVSGTTIGAVGAPPETGLRFQAVASGGAANVGISLVNTGSSGGLSVTGTGAPGSGGTIANKTGGDGSTTAGIGVYLENTSSVSLSRMQLNDFSNFAIRGFTVTGFALLDSTVSGTSGNNGGVDEGAVVFGNFPPSTTSGLLGTGSIANCSISGGIEDNVRIVNHASALTQLTVSNSTIRDNSAVSPGNEGILLQAEGTASMTADFVNNTFLRNRANGIHVIQQGSGNVDVEIGQAGVAGSGGAFNDNNIGVNINTNSSGDLTFTLRQASIDGLNVPPGTGGSASPVNVNVGGSSTAASVLSGTIEDVVITNSDSSTGPGMRLIANGAGIMTLLVQRNNVSQVANRGIEILTRDGTATINATLLNNTVTLTQALSADAIRADAGASSTLPDSGTLCADFRGNTATTIVGLFGIRVRQRFSTTYRIEGYAGAPADDVAVAAFLSVNNNGALASADHSAAGSAGFLGSGGCPVP